MFKHYLIFFTTLLLTLSALVVSVTPKDSTEDSYWTIRNKLEPCTKPNQTALSYRGDGSDLGRTYEALTTCPNITSLDLDFTWAGCVAPEDPWAFTFRQGDRFPDLRKLSLSDYDLEGRDQWRVMRWSLLSQAQDIIGKVLPSSMWTDVQLQESNLEKWMKVMNFSQLQELHLGPGSKHFYERMKHELPNLRSLSMTLGIAEELQISNPQFDFLNSIPPLESLSVRILTPSSYDNPRSPNRTHFPLSPILSRHGPTLHSLSLTQPESPPNTHFRRPTLSLQNLTAIHTSCPSLTHLNLDIDRDNGTWPNATFDALTSTILPSLTSLTLNLEIGADLHVNEPGEYGWNPRGLEGDGPWREPRMSLGVAEALFRDLRAKKQGRELERVEFVVGDYDEVGYMGPLYFPSWEEGRARKFVCQVEGRERGGCIEWYRWSRARGGDILPGNW